MRLLLDAGLSAKQLDLRLRAVGIAPDSLDGILLTHEHGDHTRGLRVFNYDEELLETDAKRSWATKQRTSSRHGHLSNIQVMELLGEIAHPALGQVALGHLSSDCNKPDLALRLMRECLCRHGLAGATVHCATQHEPTGWFSV